LAIFSSSTKLKVWSFCFASARRFCRFFTDLPLPGKGGGFFLG
jgi:hypothetical protein